MWNMKEEGNILCSVILTGLAILGIFVVSYIWEYFKAINYFKRHNLPYQWPVPIFGNLLPIILKKKAVSDVILDLYRKFPNVKYSGAFEFLSPIFLLRDPELIKSISVKYFDHFPDHKAFIDVDLDPFFGANLFAMKGERWREMRTIITPVFTSSKMRTMFGLMTKCADDFVDYLEKQPLPLTLDMKDIFSRFTNDVIATTAFGISVNSLENRNNEFYVMGKDATNFTGLRRLKIFLFSSSPRLSKFLKMKFLPSRVTDFFRNLVSDTISTRERQGIVRPDLIQQLMQARHKLNDEKLTPDEITAQAFIFFFAGFETVSILMCFTCHQLAVHPDIQDKLVAEIDAAYEEETDKLSYEKVNRMAYLEMVLNETLRYYPPIVLTDRMSTREFELSPFTETAKPILLKPGSRVWFPTYALHHDPAYFPNPEMFDPERFSPENKGSINPFAFIPFGVGPRVCPGNRFALMETKLVLCSLLRKFRIKISAKTHLPLVLTKNSPTMAAEHGFWLDLEPRNSAGQLDKN